MVTLLKPSAIWRRLYRHCERSEAIQSRANSLDCFVASLLATTAEVRPRKSKKGRDRSRPLLFSPVMPGLDPGMTMVGASVRSALRRGSRPRLDQRVVVDGFALRLLVGQLALRRDVPVFGRLPKPVLGRLLLVHLRSASTLDAGFLQTFHHRVLRGCQRVHRRLRRLRTGRRVADVLPPQ